MQALGSATLPAGRWLCEIKFDGYRAVAVLNRGAVELWSRNHRPLGPDYPEVVARLGRIKCRSAALDGEIVALDDRGRSRFQLLQNFGQAGARPPLVYYVFDLMQLDGRSTVELPLEDRQHLLRRLIPRPTRTVQLSPSFAVEPAELMATARAQQLEGIVIKRPGSRYESGRRSGAWLKCKLLGEQEFVIGGFTRPQASREYFGAILIGYYQGGRLLYAGKVGTGFNRALLASLHAQFQRRQRADCPFADLPTERRSRFGTGMTRRERAKVTWIRPELVAQI
jgi:bifunctional non-homologous end joining protein LigD